MKWKDMIGQTFGTINVIRRASTDETPWHSHSTPLLCKCNVCNQEIVMRKEDVEKGCVSCKIKAGEISGGRGHRALKQGDRFGLLTVIEYEKPYYAPSGQTISYIKCQCDCGNIVSVRKAHLLGRWKNGALHYTISCGCSQESAGELYVKNMLNQLNINYKTQYVIPELSQWMKFDFAIFNRKKELAFLIEYDGVQHFQPVELWGGEEKLNIQKERDARKNAYCKEQGIPLIRIPYTEKLKDLRYLDLFPSSRFEI